VWSRAGSGLRIYLSLQLTAMTERNGETPEARQKCNRAAAAITGAAQNLVQQEESSNSQGRFASHGCVPSIQPTGQRHIVCLMVASHPIASNHPLFLTLSHRLGLYGLVPFSCFLFFCLTLRVCGPNGGECRWLACGFLTFTSLSWVFLALPILLNCCPS
jgi:hypothetical protein